MLASPQPVLQREIFSTGMDTNYRTHSQEQQLHTSSSSAQSQQEDWLLAYRKQIAASANKPRVNQVQALTKSYLRELDSSTNLKLQSSIVPTQATQQERFNNNNKLSPPQNYVGSGPAPAQGGLPLQRANLLRQQQRQEPQNAASSMTAATLQGLLPMKSSSEWNNLSQQQQCSQQPSYLQNINSDRAGTPAQNLTTTSSSSINNNNNYPYLEHQQRQQQQQHQMPPSLHQAHQQHLQRESSSNTRTIPSLAHFSAQNPVDLRSTSFDSSAVETQREANEYTGGAFPYQGPQQAPFPGYMDQSQQAALLRYMFLNPFLPANYSPNPNTPGAVLNQSAGPSINLNASSQHQQLQQRPSTGNLNSINATPNVKSFAGMRSNSTSSLDSGRPTPESSSARLFASVNPFSQGMKDAAVQDSPEQFQQQFQLHQLQQLRQLQQFELLRRQNLSLYGSGLPENSSFSSMFSDSMSNSAPPGNRVGGPNLNSNSPSPMPPLAFNHLAGMASRLPLAQQHRLDATGNPASSSSPQKRSRNEDPERPMAVRKRKKSTSCTSKYRGVTWHKRDRRWIARAWVDGKIRNLGSFATEKEAALVVERKYIDTYGNSAAVLKESDLVETEDSNNDNEPGSSPSNQQQQSAKADKKTKSTSFPSSKAN